MNGYQMHADAYRQFMEQHENDPTIDKESMQRKIKALEIMATTDKATRYELFNSSGFNDIAKGYFLMTIDYVLNDADIDEIAEIDDDTRHELRRHLRNQLAYIFDTTGAEQAETYYMEH